MKLPLYSNLPNSQKVSSDYLVIKALVAHTMWSLRVKFKTMGVFLDTHLFHSFSDMLKDGWDVQSDKNETNNNSGIKSLLP
jgi:hypothetical protein